MTSIKCPESQTYSKHNMNVYYIHLQEILACLVCLNGDCHKCLHLHQNSLNVIAYNNLILVTLFNQYTFIESLLQTALDNFIHVGKSNSSISTTSSSSRFDNSPSPLSVLKLILSGDRFLVNLHC